LLLCQQTARLYDKPGEWPMSTVLDVPNSTLGVATRRSAPLTDAAATVPLVGDPLQEGNRLGAARGIARGILLSLPVWALTGVVAYLLW